MDIREALLNPKLKKESVYLPSIDANVTVMEMNAVRLSGYESLVYVPDENMKVTLNAENIAAKVAVYSVVDDEGELIFSSSDVETLSQTYGKDLKIISDAAARLSGLFNPEFIEKN